MGSAPWQLGPTLTRRLRDDGARRFASARAGDAPRLLFVDDDPTAAILLRARYRRELAEGALEFHFVDSGREALAWLSRHPEIEVVVTDLEMPEMSGHELLERVRAQHPLIRAIVVSGHDDIANVRAAMNQGAFDFLTKPIDFHDFEITIAKTIAHARALRRVAFARREKLAALGRLVTSVAHELSTPIGVALTATTLAHGQATDLEKRFRDGSLRRSELARFVQGSREVSQLAVDSLKRASDLLEGFKRLAIDQHPESRGELRVVELFETVCRRVAPMLRGSSHCVMTSCPPTLTLRTYPDALTRALTNLVANAIEHAYADGELGTIELQAVAEDEDSVTIRVVDDGAGMTEETRRRVFEPFFTTRRADGSSGLGMSVVHNIVVDLLRGAVRVRSGGRAGTTVSVHLPRRGGGRVA